MSQGEGNTAPTNGRETKNCKEDYKVQYSRNTRNVNDLGRGNYTHSVADAEIEEEGGV